MFEFISKQPASTRFSELQHTLSPTTKQVTGNLIQQNAFSVPFNTEAGVGGLSANSVSVNCERSTVRICETDVKRLKI